MARKILIVDDSAINRALLKNSLSKDYDVTEAADGAEALAAIHRQYKLLSAVLLDIQMPVMDGFEVLRRMRENPLLGQIPVIVVTSSEDDETRVRALSLGANDFVTKPYNPEIIRHCLRNNIALRETASIINAIQKDKLTGIYNREFFFEKAGDMIKSQPPGYYILACIDIDNFKLVNDQYGTVEGDRILKHLAAAFSETFDQVGGLCGRISGDNFAVLYPASQETVDYVTKGHEGRYLPKHFKANPFVSVGRYVINDRSLPVSALYDRAFIAKQSVKGRYDKHIAYFDEGMLRSLVKEQQIVGDMDAAIRNREFEVWYQPQYNHLTGAMIGAEALVRWRHPEKGLVPPSDFIPVFERNGFIFELDKYVWEEAVKGLRHRLDTGRAALPVSVNVSRYDVFKEELTDTLTALVQKYGVPVSLLRLEITESAFSKSAGQIIAVVCRLLNAGFTVEIDDFGSGYSSLNTLKDVPAQVLKLDMRFLEDTRNTRRGGNILESIVRMAKWLGMTVIAEGVETITQADYLKSIGCTSLQGYLYARPMPFAEFEALADKKGEAGAADVLQTIDNLDNNAFWDPQSMDTLIFNSYVGGACILEYHDGKIELLRANDKYAQILGGASVEALMKIDWLGHMDRAYVAAFTKALAQAARTHTEFTAEYVFLDIPGCPRELYLRSVIRVIASVEGRHLVYCISENITRQRTAERLLQESAAQMRLLADNIPGGLATYRYQGGRYSVLFFNDGLCRLFGCTREEYLALCTQDVMSHVFKEDLPTLKERLAQMVSTDEPVNTTYRVHVKDGYKWIQHHGRVSEREGDALKINVVLLDVTQEQEAAERLRVSAEAYRLAVRHSGTIICRFNIVERTSSLEPEVAQRLGLPQTLEDIPYAQVRQGLVAPESEKAYIDFYEEILHGGASGEAMYRFKLANGYRWQKAHYSTVFSDGGKPLFAVLSFLDVTEQIEKEAVYKQWQQALMEKNPQAYALYRCNLSRESIVEKMSGAMMNEELDQKHQRLDERTAAYVRRYIHPDDQAEFQAMLNVNALLGNYFRGNRTLALEYRELRGDGSARWLRLSVELSEGIGSKDIEARLMFEDIDHEKKEALSAQKKTENDSLTGALNRASFALKLRERLDALQAPRQCALLMLDIDGFKLVNDFLGHAAGDRALADIAATLRGILRKEDLLGRFGGDEFLIFLNDIPDEAAAVNKARQVCALVRKTFSVDVQISGSVGIVLYPRDGTDFDLLCQKADAAMYFVKEAGRNNYAVYHPGMEAEERGMHPHSDAAHLRRMLIVDDNQMDHAMLENIFKNDYRIEKAKDGASALIRLRHYGSAISVVLLDLIMPGMDGFAVLERMQRAMELRSIPVIVVSGAGDPEVNLRALKSGAADFVVKPVNPDVLRVRVRSAISRAENERLRAQNSLVELQSNETWRYKTVLNKNGIYVIEHDWVQNTFVYDSALSDVLTGAFDGRKLWHILLSDMVADTATVKQMQELVHTLAADRKRTEASLFVRLKLVSRAYHWFLLRIYKATDEFGLTDRMLLTLCDRGAEMPAEAPETEASDHKNIL